MQRTDSDMIIGAFQYQISQQRIAEPLFHHGENGIVIVHGQPDIGMQASAVKGIQRFAEASLFQQKIRFSSQIVQRQYIFFRQEDDLSAERRQMGLFSEMLFLIRLQRLD